MSDGSRTSLPIDLSIIIPALNEAGNIGPLATRCRAVIERLGVQAEILVVDGGSSDGTVQEATEAGARVIQQEGRGYGGALRTGFATATRELVFYTDGDAQYDPAEMVVLWRAFNDEVDLVNGYKISRSDPLHRIIIGRVYHHTVKILFGLTVRDVDCDFRMMRRSIFDKVRLEKNSGVICLEMMKKITDANFRIAEVPVHHYHRAYGRSQFFNFGRLARTAIDVFKLWFALVIRREHLKAGAVVGQPHAR